MSLTPPTVPAVAWIALLALLAAALLTWQRALTAGLGGTPGSHWPGARAALRPANPAPPWGSAAAISTRV